ncbi:site-specific tyrosine recombinase [Clostridium aminobutyricum]|uniref:Tyrosine recombinase XerC n=1 Tax=Clostridium aminobutyricum TaxID=33953 RepID=A0A939D5X2_CLOAM|nr:site-specific tyrosine recombinase [Clostridium aminobutyricum]MBN7771889.1 tyrosine recombinase XerD [Clostridium aminobutyricum]
MNDYIEQFKTYLLKERKMSENSLHAYYRDVLEYSRFLEEKQGGGLKESSNTEIVSFVLKLKNDGKSSATVNRKVASLRAFYNFMMEKEYVTVNPVANIKSPKIERKELEFLTIEEVDKLLSLPDDSIKGKRDRAILEIMYATGIRVSEIIETKVSDINLRMGFVTCTGEHGKARIIPMGRPARAAVEAYIYETRDKLLKKSKEEEEALFLNYFGEKLTRQGLWKILKEYAATAGFESKITPQTLRNSFAVHMIQNGADLKSLQELLGHEDITATQIYLSVTKNRIKDVYDRAHPRA